MDLKVSNLLEPCATSPKGRIETLKKLHSEGIKTYLFMSPIFPEITNFKEIIDEVKHYVDEIFFENLNIRVNNRKIVYEFIEKYDQKLIPLYEVFKKDVSYWKKLKREICDYCDEEDIDFEIYFHHGKVDNAL